MYIYIYIHCHSVYMHPQPYYHIYKETLPKASGILQTCGCESFVCRERKNMHWRNLKIHSLYTGPGHKPDMIQKITMETHNHTVGENKPRVTQERSRNREDTIGNR